MGHRRGVLQLRHHQPHHLGRGPACHGAHLRRPARDAAFQGSRHLATAAPRHRRRAGARLVQLDHRERSLRRYHGAPLVQRHLPLLRRQTLEDRGLACGGQRRHRHAHEAHHRSRHHRGRQVPALHGVGREQQPAYLLGRRRGQVGRRDAQDPDHRLVHRASARGSRGSRLAARPEHVVRPGRRQVRRLLG